MRVCAVCVWTVLIKFRSKTCDPALFFFLLAPRQLFPLREEMERQSKISIFNYITVTNIIIIIYYIYIIESSYNIRIL